MLQLPSPAAGKKIPHARHRIPPRGHRQRPARAYEQQLDIEAAQLAAFPPRNREGFMAHWAKILQDGRTTNRTTLFDGQVAGFIVSFPLEGHREVGYWIGREFWGKGIATRALRQFLEVERRRPLCGYVAKHNIPSRRVLEKCGFNVIREEQRPSQVQGEVIEEFVLELTGD